MELLVLFGAMLVVYCGWLVILDELRTWRVSMRVAPEKKRRPSTSSVRGTATLFAGPGRGGDGVARWPAPLRGSV